MDKLLVKKLDPAAHPPHRAKEGDLGTISSRLMKL